VISHHQIILSFQMIELPVEHGHVTMRLDCLCLCHVFSVTVSCKIQFLAFIWMLNLKDLHELP